MRHIFLFLKLLVFLTALTPNVALAGIFNAQTAELENGMRIVFIPNHRAPVVTHMIWIKAGAMDEPQGISGLAHFLEHLMFKGTENTKPGEFSRIIKTLGGNHNAFTSKDYTAYFETVAVEHLDQVMRLNADRITHLSPPQEEIISERNVVLEERRQRVDNNPSTQFQEHLTATHYLTHPYANPVIGWMGELKNINWDQALKFYRKFYVPNNMILVVTGDLEFKDLVEKAEKYYGPLKPKPIKRYPSPVLPDLVGEKTLVYEGKTILQPSLYRIYSAPSFSQDKKNSLALQVLAEILSGAPASYLHDEIVVEQKLASSVSAYYSEYTRAHSRVQFSISPLHGVPLKKLETALEKALEDLYKHDLNQDRVARAKSRLVAQAIYARDSLSGPPMIMGRAITSGAQLEDIEDWDQLIKSVPFNDVKKVLYKYFISPDRAPVTGYLEPAPEIVKKEDTKQKYKRGR